MHTSRHSRYATNHRGLVSTPKTMKARYAGVCSVTGQAINPGDWIEYDSATRTSKLLPPIDDGRYISNVIRTSGGEFYRNKNGRCEDAPACGCCNI